MEFEDYKNLLYVDTSVLDEELVRQPVLYQQVSEQTVLLESQRDAAYEKIKQIDAELNIVLREELTASGAKVTEAVVSSAVQSHPNHISAHEKYIELRTKASLFATLRDSFSQRSYMLRDLTTLHVSGYAMSSSISGTIKDSKEAAYEKNKRAIGEKLHNK